MNAQFVLLVLFGLLLVATVLSFWRAGVRRGVLRRRYRSRRLDGFREPRVMEVRHNQAPLYGDRDLPVRSSGAMAAHKLESPSEQQELVGPSEPSGRRQA